MRQTNEPTRDERSAPKGDRVWPDAEERSVQPRANGKREGALATFVRRLGMLFSIDPRSGSR